ncbi:uncharacterized protein LOC6567436 [Drosophila grimshawi]|uniref:GH13376 n=1 Tax=Drosophila grimshawi TaxID=7222 RepID=B4JT57_DROGR|nr:uncharacterized protein LOC6567436 [Drosophila grimshawi]EDV94947.1 GH13376 [Drosophila grimshawi]
MLQTNKLLQKEQVELYAIEKKLLKIIPKVQEAMNSLKVEELHLKSLSVQQALSTQTVASSSDVTISEILPAQSMVTASEQINRQEIDLDIVGSKLELYDVESDSDEAQF